MNKEEYLQLLKDGRWQRKRLEIMNRDEFKCRDCGTTNDLNVHHLRYLTGRKPWEYENSDLITLCGDCHKKRHKEIDGMCYDCANCIEEAILCESCAYQIGCKANNNGKACEKFRYKSCLSCLHFQIDGDETFDGYCTWKGKKVESGGPFAEDCDAEGYYPVALNNEEWKEYVKKHGWD